MRRCGMRHRGQTAQGEIKMSISKIPHERDVTKDALPYTQRRGHAVGGVVNGKTVVTPTRAFPRGRAQLKNLQASPPHPNMVRDGNRGFAVSKAQAPTQPIQAHSSVRKPTPAPDVHPGATGRGSLVPNPQAIGRKILAQAIALASDPHHPRHFDCGDD
jgi:hypothetical protein